MERQLADLYRGVAVLATADDEHLAALELLCLVMAVDTRLDESEIAAIREISTDWRDDLPPETPFEQLLGRAVTTAQTAVAEDRVTPRLLGVRVGRVFSVSWGLAAAISTVALLLHTQASVLTDAAAGPLILKAFVAATMGGFGSVTGAFLGGLALGVIENLSGFYINTGSRAAVAMIFVVVILMAKPDGLFSKARPREV